MQQFGLVLKKIIGGKMRESKRTLTAFSFLAFFSFGFIDNLKGPVLPELLRRERMSLAEGGTVLFGAYVGFILATLITGVVADRIGNRKVLSIAGVLLSLGLFGVSLNISYISLVLMMGCIGLGLGAIEVGANGLIVELHPKSPGLFLNLLATFHGTGSFLVPLYVAWLIQSGVEWQRIFLYVTVLSGVLAIAFAVSPHGQPATTNLVQSKPRWKDSLHVGFQWPMGWYYLLICSYVAVELGVAAWLMEYLQQIYGMETLQSSYYLSGFFVAIMLGRFFGSFVVEAIGYLKVVGLSLLGGILCLLTGILGDDNLLIAFPLSGVFFSIVFPTVTAVVTGLHAESKGVLLGILFTFGGIGGALGPWSIGQVSQTFGLRVGLCLTIVFGIISFIALLIVMRSNSTKSQ